MNTGIAMADEVYQYKIRVAVNQIKNDHIQLYVLIMKIKQNFLYEMVNRKLTNKI